MQTSTSTISANVMRRVRTIHAVRPFISGTALASFLFLFAMWGIGREVWVAHVIHNIPATGNVEVIARFFVSAFLNTRFVVQVLTVCAVGALVYAVRDFVRAFTPSHRIA